MTLTQLICCKNRVVISIQKTYRCFKKKRHEEFLKTSNVFSKTSNVFLKTTVCFFRYILTVFFYVLRIKKEDK